MTTPNDLTALAARMQEAQAEEQRELLEAAYKLLNPRKGLGWDRAIQHADKQCRFDSMIYGQAYESAALMLIPDGFDWAMFRTNGGLTIHAWCGSRDETFAQTPALAIASSALLAHVENRK